MGFWSNLIKRKPNIKEQKKQVGLVDFLMSSFSGKYNPELNSTYVAICNTHAKHFSKINPIAYLKEEPAAKHKYMNEILGLRPNELTSAAQFWEMVARDYYLSNLALIYIERDTTKLTRPLKRLYLMSLQKNRVEVGELNGTYIIKFQIEGESLYGTLDDFIVLVRNADPRNFFGKLDPAMDTVLKVLQTNYEGIEQAIKTSAYLRFIVQTVTLLDDDMKKERAEYFAEAYLGNKSTGVAYVDGAEEIIQVSNQTKYVNKEDMEFFEKQVYQYLGANEKILTATYNENEWQSYYESSLEPLVVKLEQELTFKLYTQREVQEGNKIHIESNRLQTASLSTRLGIADRLLKLPVIVPNVINKLLFIPETESGNKEYGFLNYVEADKQNQYQLGYIEKPKGNKSEEDEKEETQDEDSKE